MYKIFLLFVWIFVLLFGWLLVIVCNEMCQHLEDLITNSVNQYFLNDQGTSYRSTHAQIKEPFKSKTDQWILME